MKSPSSQKSSYDIPRKTALYILNKVDKTRFSLDRILEETLNKNTLLSKRDKALLNVIIYGVLRWRKRLDWVINYFSKIPLDKIDSKVLNILRMGIFQLRFLDRIPEFAVVYTCVELAKFYAGIRVAKFVNAVLRNAIRYKNVPLLPDPAENIVLYMSIAKSFPQWLIKRWVSRFSVNETKKLCDAINEVPPITVRVNTLKTDRDSLIQALKPFADKIFACNISPYGVGIKSLKSQIDKIDAYNDGWFQVQDESAQLVTFFLDPKPGEKILDACSGLGGKTGHIAQVMNNNGRIIAVDYDRKKLLRLEKTMKMLGVCNVETIQHDFKHPPFFLKEQKFDRILLDAPCSGLGVIRRNPDIKWNVFDMAKQKKRQIKILNNLASYVKKSGIIIYAVCSIEPEENEEVLKAFLNKHQEFVIEDFKSIKLPFNKTGSFKTFPHIDNMDAFFCVCLKKMTAS